MRAIRLLRLIGFREWAYRQQEALAFWFVRLCLPYWMRRCVIIQCVADATTGRYKDTILPDLTCVELLERTRELVA